MGILPKTYSRGTRRQEIRVYAQRQRFERSRKVQPRALQHLHPHPGQASRNLPAINRRCEEHQERSIRISDKIPVRIRPANV